MFTPGQAEGAERDRKSGAEEKSAAAKSCVATQSRAIRQIQFKTIFSLRSTIQSLSFCNKFLQLRLIFRRSKRYFANNRHNDLNFLLVNTIFVLHKQECIMAFLKFSWRVIRALLIIVAAVVGFFLVSILWPLAVLFIVFFPGKAYYLLCITPYIKVW